MGPTIPATKFFRFPQRPQWWVLSSSTRYVMGVVTHLNGSEGGFSFGGVPLRSSILFDAFKNTAKALGGERSCSVRGGLRRVTSRFTLRKNVTTVSSLNRNFVGSAFVVHARKRTPSCVLRHGGGGVFPSIPTVVSGVHQIASRVHHKIVTTNNSPQHRIVAIIPAERSTLCRVSNSNRC